MFVFNPIINLLKFNCNIYLRLVKKNLVEINISNSMLEFS